MIPRSDKGKKGRRPIDSLYSYNQVTFVGKQDSIPLETLRYCVEHILESSHPRVKGAGVSIHQLLSVTGGWRLLKGCPLSGLSAPPPPVQARNAPESSQRVTCAHSRKLWARTGGCMQRGCSDCEQCMLQGLSNPHALGAHILKRWDKSRLFF